jgi:hypothetical protein
MVGEAMEFLCLRRHCRIPDGQKQTPVAIWRN